MATSESNPGGPGSPAPETEDDQAKRSLVSPSPASDGSSPEPDTQRDATAPDSELAASSSSSEPPKRVPSLRAGSESRNMNPNSTALGLLGRARNPVQPSSSAITPGSVSKVDNDILAKARLFSQQRRGMSPAPNSPGPMAPSPGNVPNGFPGPLNLSRPTPNHQPNSAPVVPRQSMSERRGNKLGMKLSDIGGGSAPSPGFRRAGAPKLSDLTGDKPSVQAASRPASKLDDFKKYIDADKGWITFDGKATITRTGVNFSNGKTFSISLDEIEIIDELGRGNYGTVYKVKHSKPAVPRFGHGLSGKRPKQPIHSISDSGVSLVTHEKGDGNADGTTGMIMAMKEIRLELDDAKFTTILKELVILHECVSPYIIDFYGAFFQDGAVYMCIENMDGGSVDKLYAGGIPESILRKITYATAMGLKALKDDHNIIHRDVKPTNILINTKGQVKICDFGVSGNLVASMAKTNIGCQSYMAPERISGGSMAPTGSADGSYNVQSDIWSLGLTIIECAMGRYPYPPEVSSTIFGQLNAIVDGEPPDMPETGYSDVARDFVRKCLNKNALLRPPYAVLIKHPWLKSLSNPDTITEQVEEGEEADKIAEEVGKMAVGDSATGDAEVAEWVNSVLKHQQETLGNGQPSKPALHTAPLDTASPAGSPLLNK